MIGIVLVAHGNLATEFKRALEHVVGTQENLAAINIEADDDIELRRQEIIDAVESTNTGKGVIILTDLFGGTPSNMAISMMQDESLEVIAGINLPMLVKLAGIRENTEMSNAAKMTQEAGRKYIHIASNVLQGGE